MGKLKGFLILLSLISAFTWQESHLEQHLQGKEKRELREGNITPSGLWSCSGPFRVAQPQDAAGVPSLCVGINILPLSI